MHFDFPGVSYVLGNCTCCVGFSRSAGSRPPVQSVHSGDVIMIKTIMNYNVVGRK